MHKITTNVFMPSPKNFNMMVLGQVLYGVIFGIFKAEIFIPTLVVGAATLLLAVMTRHLMKDEGEPA